MTRGDFRYNLGGMRLTALLMLCALVGGCDDNPCIEMCQQYQRWLDTCDSTWRDSFPERRWDDVDDCYDDYWGADEGQQDECSSEASAYWERPCY